MNPALYSSKTVEWETPQWLFNELDIRFSFTLDVCATHANAKLARYFTAETDGLVQSWHGERCWMNPPYGREIGKWVKKAKEESMQGALVVGLLPVRTESRWWRENVWNYAEVRFIDGRLKFGNALNSAPFGSAIAIWWRWPELQG